MTASNSSRQPSTFSLRAGGHPHMRLLVDRKYQAMSRRVNVQPDDVTQLLGEGWIVRALKGPEAVRLEIMLGQIRCTELSEMPASLAIARPVQWVASPGGSAQVIATPPAG